MLMLHGAINHVPSEWIGWLAMLTSVIALGGGISGNTTAAIPFTDHHHVMQQTDMCFRMGMQIMLAWPDACEASKVPPVGSCMGMHGLSCQALQHVADGQHVNKGAQLSLAK